VAVRAVDLRLVALGEAGTELRPEVQTAVAALVDHHLGADMEVGEVAAVGEQVACLIAAADEDAILDLPAAGAAGEDLPAVEILAVEQRLEAVLGGSGRDGEEDQR